MISKTSAFLKNYALYLILFIYGLFYYISSSEFWPITISKTWWTPSYFEFSMLQKPLFSLFLSLFHLIPLSDFQHIYVVKAVFCVIGLTSLFFFIKLAKSLSDNKSTLNDFFICYLLICMSPLILNNFFRVRTDQIAFLVFSLFLYFNHKNKIPQSLALLALLPLIGIKEIIFLLPGLFMFIYVNGSYLNKLKLLTKIYISLASFSILIWSINLNMTSIQYLYSTYEHFEFMNAHLRFLSRTDFIIISLSTISIFYIFKSNNTKLKPYALNALIVLILLLISPQSYPYYIASLIPFFYLPFIILLMNYKFTNITKYSLLLLVLINLISLVFFEKSLYYLHNLNQTKYISEVSYDLKKFNLSYLDGMGIFPRQSFIPCFVSPDDSASNYGCTENIQNTKADIIILSGRLASITGTDISNKNYETAAPLLFISKTKKNELIKSSLSKHENLGLPTLLFGFN